MARRAALDKRIDWNSYVSAAEIQPLTTSITNVSLFLFSFSHTGVLISATPPPSDDLRYRLVSPSRVFF